MTQGFSCCCVATNHGARLALRSICGGVAARPWSRASRSATCRGGATVPKLIGVESQTCCDLEQVLIANNVARMFEDHGHCRVGRPGPMLGSVERRGIEHPIKPELEERFCFSNRSGQAFGI